MTPALSIRQPWAWAILHAGKDIENRTWRTSHRGLLLIHAGKRYDPAGAELLAQLGVQVPGELPRGGIVGQVRLSECTTDADSVWSQPDCWHWRLQDPTPLSFRPCVGRLGLFHPGR